MTLPASGAISVLAVNVELTKNPANVKTSLNDADIRILFQESTTSGTKISLGTGYGKANILPPTGVAVGSITQTNALVTWNVYTNIATNGRIIYYTVEVSNVAVPPVVVYTSPQLPNTDLIHPSSFQIPVNTLSPSTNHGETNNYTVVVKSNNENTFKTSSPATLLTLEVQPTAISGEVATTIGKTTIRLTATSANATSYNIYKDGSLTITYPQVTLPYTDTVGIYTTHSYVIQGHSTGGDGSKSTSVSATSWPNEPPAAVISSVVSTVSSITINWTQSGVNSVTPIDKYRLVLVAFGTTTPEIFAQDVTNTLRTQAITTGLTATTKYTATLYSINNWSLANTAVSISSTAWTTTITPTTAPVVTKVSDSDLGQSELTVNWTEDVAGHTSYNLIRYDVTVSTNAAVTLTGKTSPYTDTGLLSYNQYKYTLVSVNAGGSSIESPVSNIERTLPGPGNAALNVAVSLTYITTSQATVTWARPLGQINKYVVNINNSSNALIYTIDVTDTTSASLTQLIGGSGHLFAANTVYKVVIDTVNDNPVQGHTTAVSFRTKLSQPASAPSVTRSNVNDGQSQLNLSWSAITGAAHYNLVRINTTTGLSGSITAGNITAITNGWQVTITGLSSTNGLGFTVGQPFAATGTLYGGVPDSVLISAVDTTTITYQVLGGTATTPTAGSITSIYPGYLLDTVSTTGTTTLAYLDTGLGSYTLYKYALIAVNDGGPSVASSYSSPNVRTLPGPAIVPTVTTPIAIATITPTAAYIAWTCSGQITEFTVTLTKNSDSTAPSGYATPLSTGTTTNITVGAGTYTALANNTKYDVVVTTFNENSTGGVAATAVSFTTKTAVPTFSAFGTITATSIIVNWSDVGATTYDVRRFDVTAGDTTGTLLTGESRGFTDSDLTEYNEYKYEIIANNNGGSQTSAVSSTKRTLPKAPIAVTVTMTPTAGASNASAVISWALPQAWDSTYGTVTKYDLSVKVSGGTELGETGLASTITSQTINSLVSNKVYNVIVTVYNAAGSTATSGYAFTTPPIQPSAPTQNAAVAITQTQIGLTWDGVGTINSYTVTWYTYANSTYTKVLQGSALGTTKTVTGLTANTTYYFTLVANNDSAVSSLESGYSDGILTLANKAPVPEQPTASPTDWDKMSVSWSAVTVPAGVTVNYKVLRYPGAVDLGDTNSTSFSDTSLSEHADYTYRVQSWTTGGYSVSSVASATATTNYKIPGNPTIAANGVTGITYNSFTITWTKGSGTIISQNVIASALGHTTKLSGSLSANDTSYTFTGLDSNITYTIQVWEYSDNANGAGSASTTATTLVAPPAKPTIGSCTGVSSSSVTVNWTKVTGVTYQVFRNGTADANSIATGQTGSSYVDSTVNYHTDYTYYVRGSTSGGNGPFSDAATASTPYLTESVVVTPTSVKAGNNITVTMSNGVPGDTYSLAVTGTAIINGLWPRTGTLNSSGAATETINDPTSWGSLSAKVTFTTTTHVITSTAITITKAAPDSAVTIGTVTIGATSLTIPFTYVSSTKGPVEGVKVVPSTGTTMSGSTTTLSNNAGTIVVPSLTSGTDYTFGLATYNSAHDGPTSGTVTKKPLAGTAPGAPTLTGITGTSTWTPTYAAPSSTGTEDGGATATIATYKLYLNGTAVKTSTSTTMTAITAAPGVGTYLYVTCVNSGGKESSASAYVAAPGVTTISVGSNDQNNLVLNYSPSTPVAPSPTASLVDVLMTTASGQSVTSTIAAGNPTTCPWPTGISKNVNVTVFHRRVNRIGSGPWQTTGLVVYNGFVSPAAYTGSTTKTSDVLTFVYTATHTRTYTVTASGFDLKLKLNTQAYIDGQTSAGQEADSIDLTVGATLTIKVTGATSAPDGPTYGTATVRIT